MFPSLPTLIFSAGDIFTLLFYCAVLAFSIHAIVSIYHWFTFGTDRSIPMIGAIIYVAGGSFLLITMLYLLITL